MARSTNVKGAPHAKLVLSAVSLVATMGGWANFTLADHANRSADAARIESAPAAPSPPEEAPAADIMIELQPLPTITPLRVPTIAPLAPGRIPSAPALPPPAPAPVITPVPATLRVVSAPPRPKESGGGGGAPVPVTQTRSSK